MNMLSLLKRFYESLTGRLCRSDIRKSTLKDGGSGRLDIQDWQRCQCGASHYVGNQKNGKRVWCPLCNGYLQVKK